MKIHIFYVVNTHNYSCVLELYIYRDTILEMTTCAVTIKWSNTVDKIKMYPIAQNVGGVAKTLANLSFQSFCQGKCQIFNG